MFVGNPNVGAMALRQQTRWPTPPDFSVGPKLSTLQDPFNFQDNTKWNYVSGASVGAGQLYLTCANTYLGSIGTASSTGPLSQVYDLNNSQFSFQVLQRPNVGNGSTEFYCELTPDTSGATATRLMLYWNNGSITAYDEFGGISNTGNISTTDSWWRIRHGNGTLFWETSVDGNNWTTRYSRLSDQNVEALHVSFICGYYGVEPNPGQVILDNVNIPPDNFRYTPTQTANPFVGPMALRAQKRMPYASGGNQGYVDSANQTVTFTTSTDGLVDHPGAKTSVIIPNPYVGPMALRQQKHLPYVASQQQGYVDGANQILGFSTSTDGLVDHPGAQTQVVIPNPFVGPMALRNRKRMPYVSQQRQGFTDGANLAAVFGTSTDGFTDHPGAKTSVIIPNPFVGPQALRAIKRVPYVPYTAASASQAFTDAANSTWTFTATTDGFVDHLGAKTSVQTPNQFVGPTAMRQNKRLPFVSSQKQGYTDAANQHITFTLTDDGFVDHPGAQTAVSIPNPNVGPQALRNQKRLPYVTFRAQAGAQAFFDAANSTWTFTMSTDGARDGFGAMTTVIIPNPFVGPMAMRQGKKIPYVSSQQQGYTDGADTTVAFHLSPNLPDILPVILTAYTDGFTDHPGAQTSMTIPNPYVGPQALRNQKRLPYISDGRQGFADAANTTWVFITPSDGFVDHPGAQTAVIIPNPNVGPQALRNRKARPYVAQQHQGYVDGANTAWVFTTSDDGFITVQPVVYTPVIIPNPFVGPMALRHVKRMPYQTYWTPAGAQAFSDAANSNWVFTTPTDGSVDHPGAKVSVIISNPFVGPTALRSSKRIPYVSQQRQGYTDGANLAVTFVATDDGFVDHPGAQTGIIIPNPFVGPVTLRNQKRMPYVPSQQQGYVDGANLVVTFATPADGFIDHPGAQTAVVIPNPLVGPQALRSRKGRPYVASQRQGYVDGANTSWVFTRTTDGVRGARDAANLVITFADSADGSTDHPGAKTGVIIPNPGVGPQALRYSKHWPYVGQVQSTGHPVLGSADTVLTFSLLTDGIVRTIDIPVANIIAVHPGIYTVRVGPNEVRTTIIHLP